VRRNESDQGSLHQGQAFVFLRKKARLQTQFSPSRLETIIFKAKRWLLVLPLQFYDFDGGSCLYLWRSAALNCPSLTPFVLNFDRARPLLPWSQPSHHAHLPTRRFWGSRNGASHSMRYPGCLHIASTPARRYGLAGGTYLSGFWGIVSDV
jgi:hypothetical protein